MRLCTFSDDGGSSTKLGMIAGERVLDVGKAAGRPLRDVGQLVEEHQHLALATLLSRLVSLEAKAASEGAPLAAVELLAPVLRPPKITCLGINYKGHAAEQKVELPKAPLLFAKARTSIAGPRGRIELEPGQEKVDYEVELCLVVGRGGARIPRERAREHLLGYTVACDVSDRGAQYGDKQWYRGKSFPGFCPTGPVVLTADATDAGALRLTTTLNGALLQDGTTSDLIFGIDEIVAYVSRATPLEPGDLILTGTPAGVGVARDPQVFLRPGDALECAIHGIGALRVEVVAGGAS
ncbi:MAG TPA: fumarylacetoacetate hydrolase family protein [Planctomycetota bacterium]|nr:fumarylacetoacetate hydrolase family protein [Planctomycetota bacterium]